MARLKPAAKLAEPPAAPVFELVDVSCQLGPVQALSALSLKIGAGERVALIGPSGAGKSTLLNLLNGTLMPTSGQLRLMGYEVSQIGSRRRRQLQRQIGTIYQQHHLVTNLSVIHNVNAGHLGRWSFWRAAWSLLWPQASLQAAQALAQVGIADKLYSRTDRLSGGQQQRVALARVLVQDPAAILADEPTASVDPARSREVMTLLQQLSQQQRKTLVVSLHDVDFAFSHFERVLALRSGQLWFDLPAAQVTPAMIADLYRL